MQKVLVASLLTIFFSSGMREVANAQSLGQFVSAYPTTLAGGVDGTNTIVFIEDGSVMQFDDGKVKSSEALMEMPDVEDQLSMKYEVGPIYTVRDGHDPGRIRNEAFFKKMYGSTEEEVSKNLVAITWLPKSIGIKLSITKINNVDKQLQEISNELDQLVATPGGKDFLKYLQNPGGTINWRLIAGTTQRSAHSFGIAIDINAKYSDYWRSPAPPQHLIPFEIAAIFEKHGFIWGGKWSHYDSMHFEYRPELFVSNTNITQN